MYPNGYIPDSQAHFIGLKAYRNDATGIFVHNVNNFAIEGSHFADNNLNVDIVRMSTEQMY